MIFAAISLKHVKTEENYYRGPIETHQRSFKGYHPRPPTFPLSLDWGFATPPKTPVAIISRTAKATDFKFGRYIHRVHPNKSPLKILEAWAYPETGEIFGVHPIISGKGKATNFKFCARFHRIDRNKSPLKISLEVAVGVVRDSRKFSGHPHTERISRSSLR